MALRKDLRLLIVDDMAVSRQLLTQLLEQIGLVDVRAAGSGEEALGRLEERPADIVIADLGMPVMDGYTLLLRMRAGRRNRAASFLLTSGNDSDPRIAEAWQTGLDGFVAKPFKAEGLVRALEAVAGRL